MKLVKTNLYQAALVLLIAFMAGCAVQLAPRYDAALLDGITETNVTIMKLFASVSDGTDQATCAERVDTYNSVIGSVDALALQSRARPLPENPVIDRVNEHLDARGIPPLAGDVAPSADSLDQVSIQLVKMKEVDCKSGLGKGAVAAFKNAVIISMDQAITYESFLNR